MAVYPGAEDSLYVVGIPPNERQTRDVRVALYHRGGTFHESFNGGDPRDVHAPSILGMGEADISASCYSQGRGMWFGGSFDTNQILPNQAASIFVRAIDERGKKLKWTEGGTDLLVIPLPIQSTLDLRLEVQKIEQDHYGRFLVGVVAYRTPEGEGNDPFVSEAFVLRIADGRLDRTFGAGTGISSLRIAGQPYKLQIHDIKVVQMGEQQFVTGAYEPSGGGLPVPFFFRQTREQGRAGHWELMKLPRELHDVASRTNEWALSETGKTIRFVANPQPDAPYLYHYEERDITTGELVHRAALNVGISKDRVFGDPRERTHLVQVQNGRLFAWWHFGSFIRHQRFDPESPVSNSESGYLYHQAARESTPSLWRRFLQRWLEPFQNQCGDLINEEGQELRTRFGSRAAAF